MIDPNLYRSHFEIGDPEGGTEKGTSYQRAMRPHPIEAYTAGAQAAPSGKDKKSNWNFGELANNWVSEKQSQ